MQNLDVWFESYEFLKLEHLIDISFFISNGQGHVSSSYSPVPVRLDQSLWSVRSKVDRAVQRTYLFGVK